MYMYTAFKNKIPAIKISGDGAVGLERLLGLCVDCWWPAQMPCAWGDGGRRGRYQPSATMSVGCWWPTVVYASGDWPLTNESQQLWKCLGCYLGRLCLSPKGQPTVNDCLAPLPQGRKTLWCHLGPGVALGSRLRLDSSEPALCLACSPASSYTVFQISLDNSPARIAGSGSAYTEPPLWQSFRLCPARTKAWV